MTNPNILNMDDLKYLTNRQTVPAVIAKLKEMDIPFQRSGGVITTSIQAYNKALGISEQGGQTAANPVVTIK